MGQKPIVIDGIDITKKYPIEEIIDMYHKGRLRKVGLQGYIVRADADGMVGFVPWDQGTLGRLESGSTLVHASDTYAEVLRQDVEEQHPMRRRTPQERVASLMLRFLKTAKQGSGIAGLTEEQIRAITGESWLAGEPMTEEMVRRVAAHFLHAAEVANREADSHRVTRKHPYA